MGRLRALGPTAVPSSTLRQTILLPAGTIFIQAPWVLPANTHLIGVGDGLSGTVIEVLTGTAVTTMIQFGSSTTGVCNSSGICTGISVENLTLNGQAL